MASNLQRPQAIKEPFANSGDKNTIPVADTGTQRASLDEGFPEITEIPVSEGGIPPERKDMNALGYLTTSQYFYLQCGGRFTFDPDVSTAIGGYPAGAVLEYTDTNAGLSYAVMSVINNNTYNFVATPSYIDGSKWKKAFSEDLSNYVDLTSDQNIGGIKTFSSSPLAPTPSTNDNSTKMATTAFVKNQGYAADDNVIKKTGNQTKSGTLTLTASPVLPTPSSSDSSTKGATTAFVKNVLSSSGNGLATFSKSQNGYYKFTNGLIINWGLINHSNYVNGKQTVTLATPFTSTTYKIVGSLNDNTGAYNPPSYTSRTTTTFEACAYAGARNLDCLYIAIGY